MTGRQIENLKEEAARKVAVKFDAAKAIRELLDAARKQYGADNWDNDGLENEVLELVSE